MKPRKPYPTDLSDREWALIQPLVPPAKPGGRPAKYPKREILDAIFSILRGGWAWRLLPHDFPPWPMVYQYCWRWRKDGSWPRRPARLRGVDAHQQVTGRQRPRLVGTLGWLL